MSNEKHYPLHPNQSHPPIMTCEIPLEEYESLKRENAELKAKLESVQASMYCDVVDANMENRRLKRALWLARAERANAEWGHWATIWFCDTNVELNINKSSVSQKPYRCTIKRNASIWRNIWSEVERKCRAKAEEYK